MDFGTTPLDGLPVPPRVTICEVGPRDGLQNESTVLPVAAKAVFDASAGGLGGCPFAGSATGDLATEDLLWQLHGLGVETGVDLQKMVATSTWPAERLGRPSPSRTVTALAG